MIRPLYRDLNTYNHNKEKHLLLTILNWKLWLDSAVILQEPLHLQEKAQITNNLIDKLEVDRYNS